MSGRMKVREWVGEGASASKRVGERERERDGSERATMQEREGASESWREGTFESWRETHLLERARVKETHSQSARG